MSEVNVEYHEQDFGSRFRKVEVREIYKPELVNAQFAMLPMLRGFWPMSTVDGVPTVRSHSHIDISLTYNGNPVFNYDDLIPYIDLDGVGDYLSFADNVNLDISGAEAYVAPARQGLTLGGWFYLDTIAADGGLITKWMTVAVNQRAYRLIYSLAGTAFRFSISTDGTAIVNVDDTSLTTTSTGAWYFVVGRFDPSAELAIFVNNTKTINAAAIPATIFNSNAQLNLGAYDNGANGLLDGRETLCFLCAAYLTDEILDVLFQQSRGLFGV